MSLVKRVKTRIGYLLLRSLCQVFRGSLWRLGSFCGDLLYLLSEKFRRVAMSNLCLAFSSQWPENEMRRICRSSFRQFSKTILEIFSSPYLTREEIRNRVELRGDEFLRRALEKGRGAILLTAHFGNWEWLAARVCAEGLPVSYIRRLNTDPASEALIGSVLRHHGIEVIPRHDVRAALRSLHNNQILLIQPDQHAGGAGIPIPFFGHLASTYPGVAALAIRTGAPVIPGFAVRKQDDTHLVTFYPPFELLTGPDRRETIRANMVLCNKVIEDQIRQHPDHWMWFHDRWKS